MDRGLRNFLQTIDSFQQVFDNRVKMHVDLVIGMLCLLCLKEKKRKISNKLLLVQYHR